MMPDRPVEVDNIGRDLRAHRENLGITFDQLIMTTGGEHSEEFHKIERAAKLNPAIIERYHRALLLAWQASEPKVAAVIGMREQWYTTRRDWQLWDAAKALRPTVAWWWGGRRDVTPAGAYCYVCDGLIHRYDVSRGLTMRGRLAVMTHRYGHMLTLETIISTESKDTYV